MSEEGFLQLADLLPDPMLLVSAEGIVRAVNRCAALRLGAQASELREQPLAAISSDPPESVSRFLRECSRSRSLLPGSLTLLARGAAATRYRCEGAVYCPRAGDDPALVLIRLLPRTDTTGKFLLLNERIDQLNREIARRQAAEEELQKQREWFRVTLESIGDAVIATDTEGRIVFMNPVSQGLTGWPQEEASGRPLQEIFNIVNEETKQPVENPVVKVLREGVLAGLANHTVLISRDGREMPIDDCAAPIRDETGEMLGVVMIFHDIVERRNLERELARRAERLAEADRRKDEFLAMLGHELRNPLAPIRNALYIFATPGAGELAIQRARDMMERQVHHLVRLVDDLLDVSRITRGKVELQKEKLDLVAVVTRATEAARLRTEVQEQDLAVVLPAQPIWVEADPTRLDQVLANLLNNASKFTGRGGRIDLELGRDGRMARLSVRDTGIGIPRDLLPHLFEPFTQASRSLDRSQGGLGIGLTLVKRLVEMHGGTVAAYSEGPGQGSEFVVRLPLPQDAAGPQDQERPRSAGDRAARRVLVVDDNCDSADSIAMLLELWGHEVRTIYDGRDLFAAVRELGAEVVLLDIGLPGIDGYELARQLRREEDLRGLVLVAMTGYGQEEDHQRSREAGFDHHLVKPVDTQELERLLASF